MAKSKDTTLSCKAFGRRSSDGWRPTCRRSSRPETPSPSTKSTSARWNSSNESSSSSKIRRKLPPSSHTSNTRVSRCDGTSQSTSKSASRRSDPTWKNPAAAS
uniref:(northern house mosquito) hypothetical protein n=1 Tax=Culex pipiens TaxID=7175 RepID=A0A8D8BZ50_CULPI